MPLEVVLPTWQSHSELIFIQKLNLLRTDYRQDVWYSYRCGELLHLRLIWRVTQLAQSILVSRSKSCASSESEENGDLPLGEMGCFWTDATLDHHHTFLGAHNLDRLQICLEILLLIADQNKATLQMLEKDHFLSESDCMEGLHSEWARPYSYSTAIIVSALTH